MGNGKGTSPLRRYCVTEIRVDTGDKEFRCGTNKTYNPKKERGRNVLLLLKKGNQEEESTSDEDDEFFHPFWVAGRRFS